MEHLGSLAPRRALPIGLAAAGFAALAVGVLAGDRVAALGAAAFVAAAVLALLESQRRVLTWPNALILFILVVWFIPIRLYRLPVDLPFGAAELYRILLFGLLGALVVSGLLGRTTIRAAGHAKPIVALLAVAVAAQVVNAKELGSVNLDDPAKALATFLLFFVAFVLVSSVVQTEHHIDLLLGALVIGGAIVAAFSLAEGILRYNAFDHLNEWLPGFQKQPREIFELRGGRERVYASAQHPIALACAVMMMIPLALYLFRRASGGWRWVWLSAVFVLGTSALATVSKTIVVMAAAMIVVGVVLRGAAVVRFWPALIVVPILAHLLAPGAIGALWKSFFPEEGLIADLNARAGEAGSGRLGDIDPAFLLWEQSPITGKGIGALSVPRDDPGLPVPGADPTVPAIVFDNQYLTTFVELGLLGLAALVWFVWGAFWKTGVASRQISGLDGDRLAACAAACAGFGVSLFVFDAFAFIQCTLIFFIVAALGLRAWEMAMRPARSAA